MKTSPARVLILLLSLAGCGGGGGSSPVDGAAPDGPDAALITKIQEGEGPCAQGINLSLAGKTYFLPLSVLPRSSVVVDGEKREAIALAELLPASLLEPQSFSGKFSTATLRLLFDLRLSGGGDGGGALTVGADSIAAAGLLVDDRSIRLSGKPSSGPSGVCRVEALRRILVTRGMTTKTVHVEELSKVIYTEKGTKLDAFTFDAILEASGLVKKDESNADFDYRVVAVDFMKERESAIRFPWGHWHLEALRFVPAIYRTRSVDTTGTLRDGAGKAVYLGVSGAGWSSVKHPLEVILEDAPDPSHAVFWSGYRLTDPASCEGCHVENGSILIPVPCRQCHAFKRPNL
jgi:hypothetical protein